MKEILLTPNAIKSSLRGFISSLSLLKKADTLGDADSFLEKGILDSTGVLELVGHLETEYGVRVESDEITPENLDSLDKLVIYILRKMNAADCLTSPPPAIRTDQE